MKPENNISKYIIKKSPGLGHEFKEVAKVRIDDLGKIVYEMLIVDNDVEQVILEAQKEGGLFCLIPFTEKDGNLVVKGQKRAFIPATDTKYFIDALQANLKNGLVDRE
jgi:hypothetical protein